MCDGIKHAAATFENISISCVLVKWVFHFIDRTLAMMKNVLCRKAEFFFRFQDRDIDQPDASWIHSLVRSTH